jgi:membrane protein implicated in regulation of membrane protease activity
MKYYILLIALIAAIILSFWVFNHVNPWIGILLWFIVVGVSFNFIYKLFNKQQK